MISCYPTPPFALPYVATLHTPSHPLSRCHRPCLLACDGLEQIFRDPTVTDKPIEEDEDVAAETRRVDTPGTEKDDAIRLSHMRKVYRNKKVAVRDLTFGIRHGECFGFLGINGAGKTTTLKMLSGDEIRTSGVASLMGFDILKEQVKVRRLLGYCPQFDALLGASFAA